MQHKVDSQIDLQRAIISSSCHKSKTSYGSSWRDEMRGGWKGNEGILDPKVIPGRMEEK